MIYFRNHILFLGIVCCFIFFVAESNSQNVEYHISLDGNDSWSGTLEEPNEERTDGPFATFEQAQHSIRELNSAQRGIVIVYIHSGKYMLNKTIELTSADSATVWMNFPGN